MSHKEDWPRPYNGEAFRDGHDGVDWSVKQGLDIVMDNIVFTEVNIEPPTEAELETAGIVRMSDPLVVTVSYEDQPSKEVVFDLAGTVEWLEDGFVIRPDEDSLKRMKLAGLI